jgi:hypothetical protein
MPEATPAGATPAGEGATPPTPEPRPTPQTPPPPTAGEPDADGMVTDAGRKALEKERTRAAEAERKLVELQRASQSETERAITDAKSAGEREATERFTAAIRTSEVRSALTAAGVDASLIDIATRADQFASLEVTEKGEVKGLAAAVADLKKSTPALFSKSSKPNGDAGLGPRGAPVSPNDDMNTLIRRAAGRA